MTDGQRGAFSSGKSIEAGCFPRDSAMVFQQREKAQTAIHCMKNVDLLGFCPAIAMRNTVEAFVRSVGMTLINLIALVLILSD